MKHREVQPRAIFSPAQQGLHIPICSGKPGTSSISQGGGVSHRTTSLATAVLRRQPRAAGPLERTPFARDRQSLARPVPPWHPTCRPCHGAKGATLPHTPRLCLPACTGTHRGTGSPAWMQEQGKPHLPQQSASAAGGMCFKSLPYCWELKQQEEWGCFLLCRHRTRLYLVPACAQWHVLLASSFGKPL